MAKNLRPSLDKIVKCLQSVASLYSKIFIIADALDERHVSDNCRTGLLAEVFNLQHMFEVNFLVTSRHTPQITQEFKRSTWLEIRPSEEDVRTYLNERLQPRKAFLRKNTELQK